MNLKESIAIVGIGCRFPGNVSSPDDLVAFLSNHGDGIVEVPRDRWSLKRFYDADRNMPGRSYVKKAGFLTQNIFEFDPVPFGMSPRESEFLDPQQRLLLETTYDAIEDAGQKLSDLRGSATGVYIGGFNIDIRDAISHPENRDAVSSHVATGFSHTVLSNRLSYTFDWHGPSFTIDTACSSSLVTVHLGCRDLLDGIVNLAVAGGVNVMLSPLSTEVMCKGHFLAPDGRSKTFDALADGYGRGEGAGILILKRLSDAVRDGDRIYATILATAINQDGRTDGMPMPNQEAQAALCKKVCQLAGIDANRLGYVEAHGTGTRAGDPIELKALSKIYCGSNRSTPLPVGSIKTNIGHLEAGAGVAGMIKAALSLYEGKVFPIRHLGTPNPELLFKEWKIRVPLEVEPWSDNLDRTAAVNSFGYGGTNGHAILGAAPVISPVNAVEPPQSSVAFLPLSAWDEAALKSRASQFIAYPEHEFHLARGTLAHFRDHLPVRAAVLCNEREMTRGALHALAEGQPHPGLVTAKALEQPRLLWVYTGMGPQWWAMGRELLAKEPVFRAAVEQVNQYFCEVASWSLLEEFTKPEPESRMRSNAVAQPANFMLQIGLTELLRHHGIHPDGVIGHSVGELAAAWASGCLDLRTVTHLAFHRSNIQQAVAGKGSMLATALSLAEAQEICDTYKDLSIAAINGPQSVVFAGGLEAIDYLRQELEAKDVFAKKMMVEVAYHSHHMDSLELEFKERLARLKPGQTPRVALYSTAQGMKLTQATHDWKYWWKNARNPVLLEAGLKAALQDGYDIALEIGPHPVLANAIEQVAKASGNKIVTLFTQKRNVSDVETFSRTLASLYCLGKLPRWEAQVPQIRKPLPYYPFQRRYLWFESNGGLQDRIGRKDAHPFLDQKDSDISHRWSVELAGPDFAWVKDHQVQNMVVFPGAAYMEAAFACSAEIFGPDRIHVLEDLEIENALILQEGSKSEVRFELKGNRFEVSSSSGGQWQKNAAGKIPSNVRYLEKSPVDMISLIKDLTPQSVSEVYEDFERRGLLYGAAFRQIQEIWTGSNRVVAKLGTPVEWSGYGIFPGTLDAAFQALLTLLPAQWSGAVVPVRVGSIRLIKKVEGDVYCQGCVKTDDRDLIADLTLFSPSGEALLVLESLVCRSVERQEEGATLAASMVHGKRWRKLAWAEQLASRSFVLAGDRSPLHQKMMELLSAQGLLAEEAATATQDGVKHVLFVSGKSSDPIGFSDLDALRILVQSLPTTGHRLTVVTQTGYQVSQKDEVIPSQSALIGFCRVVMTERPELDPRILDLDGSESLETLLKALMQPDEFEEKALREDNLWALEYHREDFQNAERRSWRRPPKMGESFELFVEKLGRLDSLGFRPRHFIEPLGDDEIELRVQAASVNFKDVMKALGMLEEMAMHKTKAKKALGLEATGVVEAVGKNVKDFKVGDRISVFDGNTLATRVRVDQKYAVHSVPFHTPIEASSYLVFQTVWYGLMERGQLKQGEKILIHSAAGGVGLAAVQLAKYLGAEVYATVGTPEKRDMLRNLGVEHIYDSRTLDFARQIMADTNGEGVDVVLNSLTGEAFQKNFEVLRAGGRLIEIGKQDIAKNVSVGLLPFNRALSLIAVDVDRLCAEKSSFFKPTAQAVCDAFIKGIFTSLPTEVFPLSRVSDAFRLLASGGHIGKVVLDFESNDVELQPGQTPKPLFRKDRTYLVVGGLGGFGLKSALWIAEQGAGKVAIASRRGVADESALAQIQAVADRTGCAIEVCRLNAADLSQVTAIVQRLAADALPLAGILHSATILEDLPLSQLTSGSLARVMQPKAIGAWNLHLATRELPLDWFAMYSSVAGMVGNPGQAAYAAANSFLDGLAHLRRSQGLAGLSVQWGALADVGVVARDPLVEAHLRSIGLEPIRPEVALEGLKALMMEEHTERGIIDIDWDRWERSNPLTRWNRLIPLLSTNPSGESSTLAWLKDLEGLSPEERVKFVAQMVVKVLTPAFKVPESEFDLDKPLRDYGLDSIIAVELQVALEEVLGLQMSTMELLAGRSAIALSESILKRALAENAAKEESVPEKPQDKDLSEYFLQRICVQRPYFSLFDIEAKGEWLSAKVYPVPPSTAEWGDVSIAEAARHTAILGSCAAREQEMRGGKIYYPVRGARLLESVGNGFSPSSEPLLVQAKCLSYDAKASSAVSETRLSTLKGELICVFEITYHVIPEAEFIALFASHKQKTFEVRGDNPYQVWHPLPQGQWIDGRLEIDLGEVSPDWCLGHFVDYPAYPVSIMVRDSLRAVAQGIQEKQKLQAAPKIRIAGGSSGTNRFIFAGERATLTAYEIPPINGRETWRTEISVRGQLCAWFDMEIEIG